MSEYWISQGRRMCPYCKCWTADNKASINFHEQGKNHKENVTKKLDELRKKGLEDARMRQSEESDMAKIERAALESLKKDLANNSGVSSAYGIVSKSTLQSSSNASVSTTCPESERATPKGDLQPSKESGTPPNDWVETYTEDGHLYYWNSVTNETSWDPPNDGSNQIVAPPDPAPVAALNTTTSKAQAPPSIVKRKAPPVKDATTGFGQWERVESEPDESVTDYDLPTDSKYMTTLPEDIPLPPSGATSDAIDTPASDAPEQPTKFKEKRVVLGSVGKGSESVAFKKPRMAKKRQTRGALDDE